MKLKQVGAPELAAIADEEVVPLAAEIAHAYRLFDEAALVEQVVDLARNVGHIENKREALAMLTAAGLASLAGLPGQTVLYQTPANTRPIRVSCEDFIAFRFGRLRSAIFTAETYGVPRAGDVVRILEKIEDHLTGRDAFAEILHVTTGNTAGGDPYYLVSIRPWRGAGTDSAAQAVLDERRRLLEQVMVGMGQLREAFDPFSRETVCLNAMLRSLARAMALCGSRPGQTGQTSMSSSNSPSGQDGMVMGPPGKVSTTQIR